MRFSALPVLMDPNVHCAPVLENRITCLIRLKFQKSLSAKPFHNWFFCRT